MNTLAEWVLATQWFFLAYYLALHACYFGLLALAARHLARHGRPWFHYVEERALAGPPYPFSGLEPGISIISPMYEEEGGAVRAVHTFLHQRYPTHEVVLVNDGSPDRTLELLIAAFDFVPTDERQDALAAPPLPHAPIRGVYRSQRHRNLWLLDKENAGKSDALNAGVSFAHHGLCLAVDGDTILEPDSLARAARPFLEDERMLAVGGTLGVLNGNTVGADGFVRRAGLRRNVWSLVQTLEYLRAFLFARIGWVPFNAMPLISGAFGLIRRDVLLRFGGFRRDTGGEDIEWTLRLHRYARAQDLPYRIGFVAEPLCWTEVPTDGRTLGRQRARWHVFLSQALAANRGLVRQGGVVGLVVWPFYVIFEWLTPLVELAGYASVVAAWALGLLDTPAALLLLALVLAVGALLSACTLLLEQLHFDRYLGWRPLAALFLVACVENLGYRQLHAVWRARGLVRWLIRPGTSWQADLALEQTRALVPARPLLPTRTPEQGERLGATDAGDPLLDTDASRTRRSRSSRRSGGR